MTRLELAALDLVKAEGHVKAAQHFGISRPAYDAAMQEVVAAFDRLKEAAEEAKGQLPVRVASASQMLGMAVRAQGQCIEELALMLVAVATTLPESEAKPLRDQLGSVLDRAKLVTDEALEAVA